MSKIGFYKTLPFTVFFILFLAASNLAFAQAPQVKWSKDLDIDRSERYLDIIGSNDSSFFVFKDIKGSDREFKLEQFNTETLKLESGTEVKLPRVKDQPTFFEEFLFLNNRFYLFSSHENAKSERRKVYAVQVNTAGEHVGNVVEVDDFFLGKKRKQIEFDVKLSVDSTHFLVYHNRPYSKESDEVFSFRVFDRDLRLTYSKELSLPYDQEAFEVTDYLFDGKSNIYMLSGITPEKRETRLPRVGPENKRYVLLNYDFEANTLKEYDVSVKDKWINSVTFGITPDGDLAIGGFYSNDFRFAISGTFYFLLDGADKSVKASGLMPFDREFLRKFNAGRTTENRELEDYFFDHFLLFENGEALLIAEQYYMTEMIRTDPATGYQTITYSYNYNDIILVKINSDGSIAWNVKVPKYQATVNDNGPFSSYALVWNKDVVHLAFNDHSENLDKLRKNENADLRSFGNVRKSVATVVSVNRKGEMNRQILFDSRDMKVVMKPKNAFQSGPRELLIYGKWRRDYKFGRIRF
jgi:hypothetical protein